jgi:hypothetical protein
MFRRKKKPTNPPLTAQEYDKIYPVWLDRTRLLNSYRGIVGGVAWHFEKWDVEGGDAGGGHVLFDPETHEEIRIGGPLTEENIRAYAARRFGK